MIEPGQIKKQQPGERYRNYMLRIIADCLCAKVGKPPTQPCIGEDKAATKEEEQWLDNEARRLHETLCRKHGMTADEIIAEWNHRSPEDTW